MTALRSLVADLGSFRNLSGVRIHGCASDETRIREVLEVMAVDLDLNAQGLEVWLVLQKRKGRPA